MTKPPDPSASDREPADRPPGVVEWRLASPDGSEQYGPTVPTVFAQWIADGRVRPDWLVWRTGWPDWRKAADAVDELPRPEPAAAAPSSADETAETTKPVKPSAASVSQYRNRRRAAARRNAILAFGLGVVALALIALLLWLVGS